MNRRATRGEEGFTLVELLVTMALLMVIGTVVVLSIMQGSRSTARAQDRAEALNEVQLAMERVSREIRAANPLTVANAAAVEMDIVRDGRSLHLAYALSAGDLVESRTVGATTNTTVLAEDVSAFALTYFDEDDVQLAAPVTAVGQIVRVHVRIARFITAPAAPIVVETSVHVRNST